MRIATGFILEQSVTRKGRTSERAPAGRHTTESDAQPPDRERPGHTARLDGMLRRRHTVIRPRRPSLGDESASGPSRPGSACDRRAVRARRVRAVALRGGSEPAARAERRIDPHAADRTHSPLARVAAPHRGRARVLHASERPARGRHAPAREPSGLPRAVAPGTGTSGGHPGARCRHGVREAIGTAGRPYRFRAAASRLAAERR